jgi:hypothetical protein
MIKFILYGNNKPNLIKQIEALSPTERFSVEIKPYKSKRSSEQNSRYWALVTGLGKHIGYTPDETHDILRFKFLRNAIEINGERLPLLRTTTKLNTAEFTDYMDAVERFGHSIGYYFEE